MKTLFATDGSDHARLAETLVARLPALLRSELAVVTVTQPPVALLSLLGPFRSLEPGDGNLDLLEELRKASQRVLDEAVERLRRAGADPTPLRLDGEVAETLVALAEQEGFELLVVGSRGDVLLKAALLGSVARRLLSSGVASVLVGRVFEGGKVESSRQRLASKETLDVLLAVDDSPGSAEASRLARSVLAGALGTLHVVSVEPPLLLPPTFPPLGVPVDVGRGAENARRIAEAEAATWQADAVRVEVHSPVGRPASTVVDLAQTLDVDLIVVGANRGGALVRHLLGSVSYEVATTAPCSVLVARGKQ